MNAVSQAAMPLMRVQNTYQFNLNQRYAMLIAKSFEERIWLKDGSISYVSLMTCVPVRERWFL
jgi:hypothetical protein